MTRCEHPSRAGLGPGGQCLQRGQMAVQPCQTAWGHVRHLAPGLAPHWPPWAGAGVVGPQAGEEVIVWGWAALQWPFVRLSWPRARGSAGPPLTLTPEVDPSSAGGIVVSPTAPAPP